MAQKEGRVPSPNDQLIRVGKETFRIEFREAGQPHLTKLSLDDIAEYTLMCNIDAMYVDDIERTINTVYEDITKSAKQNLQNIVLKAIGFDHSWGEWKIDHCNGRLSTLSDLLRDEVKQFILNEQLNVKELLLDPGLKDILRTEMSKYVQERALRSVQDYDMQRYVRDLLDAEIKTAIKDHVKENMMDIVVKKLEGKAYKSSKELMEEIKLKKDRRAALEANVGQLSLFDVKDTTET